MKYDHLDASSLAGRSRAGGYMGYAVVLWPLTSSVLHNGALGGERHVAIMGTRQLLAFT